MEEAVFYKESEGILYLRATGHLTARVCPGIKSRLFGRLDADPPVEAVMIDLGSCDYMDSTFLGLIVGAQKRLAAARLRAGGDASRPRRIVLARPSETCIGLFRTLGVLGMLEVRPEEPPFPVELEPIADETKATAGFILEAHEELTALSDENKAKFAALSAALRNALEGETGSRGKP